MRGSRTFLRANMLSNTIYKLFLIVPYRGVANTGSPAEMVLSNTIERALSRLRADRNGFELAEGIFLLQPSFVALLCLFLSRGSELLSTISAGEPKYRVLDIMGRQSPLVGHTFFLWYAALA